MPSFEDCRDEALQGAQREAMTRPKLSLGHTQDPQAGALTYRLPHFGPEEGDPFPPRHLRMLGLVMEPMGQDSRGLWGWPYKLGLGKGDGVRSE